MTPLPKIKIIKFSKQESNNLQAGSIYKIQKPYQCEICGYSYSKKAILKIHVDFAHEGKKYTKLKKLMKT